MKLSALKPQTAELELIHPKLGATGIILQLTGQDTKDYMDRSLSFTRSLAGKQTQDMDLEKVRQQNVALLASCIFGWSGLEDEDGEPLPFSQANAVKVLADPEHAWMREQVEVFTATRKNFFR